jgi:hypothetical protein
MFESYPDPNSPECIEFNGCTWAGKFKAYPQEVKTEQWVSQNDIAAVHMDHYGDYEWKTLRLRAAGRTIDVQVIDACNDADCSGCCTQNYRGTGFLIDLEKYTWERFGVGWEHETVEWTCLDCEWSE